MAKRITRSELNAHFYGKIDDEINEIKKASSINNDKLIKIKKRLSLIDNDYFNQIIDEIDQTIGIQSLYLDNALTDEEKFFSLKNGIQNYLEEINSIVDQKIELVDHFDDVFSLKQNQVAFGVENRLQELMTQLNKIPSIGEKNALILKDFQRLYPGLEKNLLIIDEKYETEKDGGMSFQARLANTKASNKTVITEIKRNLNHYKIQWIWYVVIVSLLLLGIVLAILIPIFVV